MPLQELDSNGNHNTTHSRFWSRPDMSFHIAFVEGWTTGMADLK
jgi:hypothetical protein